MSLHTRKPNPKRAADTEKTAKRVRAEQQGGQWPHAKSGGSGPLQTTNSKAMMMSIKRRRVQKSVILVRSKACTCNNRSAPQGHFNSGSCRCAPESSTRVECAGAESTPIITLERSSKALEHKRYMASKSLLYFINLMRIIKTLLQFLTP